MILQLIILFLSAALLYVGAELVVRKCVSLAKTLKVTSTFLAWTVVACGTSLPELIVSVIAGIRKAHEVAVGNILGSNIANIAIILGFCSFIYTIRINLKNFLPEYFMMLFATFLFYIFSLNKNISQREGLLFLLLLTLFVYLMRKKAVAIANDEKKNITFFPFLLDVSLMGAGFLSLLFGGRLLVSSILEICKLTGISPYIMGTSVVAVLTSAPEFVTSFVAGQRGHFEICVGNVLGSNLANILLIIGVASCISPLSISKEQIILDFPTLFLFSGLVFLFLKDGCINRREGFSFLVLYGLFLFLLSTI